MTSKQSKYLRRAEVLATYCISGTTLRRWMEQDAFPQPIAFGPRTLLWSKAEIDARLRKRRKEPRQKQPQPEAFRPRPRAQEDRVIA